jgi:hypothetical protein
MTTLTPSSHPSWAIRLLLMPVTNIRFGLVCIFVLLVYMSIGSAIPPIRQDPRFDMTEYEWFNTWVFYVLIGLVCLNLSSITIRRIRFSKLTLGVWMIHTGVVTLCLSSAYYFLTKVEGDTPVIRRSISITTSDGQHDTIPALPGASTRLGDTTFSIASVDPSWPILSGEHEGELALSINVAVDSPEAQFIRQVLVGYPQYTEDIIPGQGRAIKSTGKRLLDESLTIEPEYLPQSWFYLKDSRALYARRVDADGAAGSWQMYDLSDLPRYNDIVADPGRVFAQGASTRVIQRNLNITPRLESSDDLLESFDATVTGYLRYAALQSSLHPGQRTVRIRIPALGVEITADPAQTPGAVSTKPFIPIGQTGYSYRIAMFSDDLKFPDGRIIPMVGLDIRTPEGEFTRLLSSDDTMSFDFPLGQFDLETTLPEDTSIEVEYDHGGHVDKVPAIVPRARRDRGAGVLFSMISLSLGSEHENSNIWLPYHQYVFDSPQFAYSGRFRFSPTSITTDDGQHIELIFSRKRQALPSAVVLEDFVLTSNIGGFTGQQASIRDWTSHIRFATDDGWSEQQSVSTNQPVEHDGLWFFQASWDPPQQTSNGFAYTGLGVGNRNGVRMMLASSTLAALGMCYAFYIKPIIRRNRIKRVHAQVRAKKIESKPQPQPEPAEVLS